MPARPAAPEPAATAATAMPPGLVSMTAYVLASVASTLAPGMDWLIVWRTVQGAGVMGARAMSKGLSGLGVIACLNAPLGGDLAPPHFCGVLGAGGVDTGTTARPT